MTRRLLAAFLASQIAFAATIVGVSYRAPKPVPAIITPARGSTSSVEHPRCFPEGTLATEGFPLCPDSLPDMRSV